jgi:hypothetical protein
MGSSLSQDYAVAVVALDRHQWLYSDSQTVGEEIERLRRVMAA